MKINTTAEKVNAGLTELRDNGASVRVYDDGSGQVSVQGVSATFQYEDGVLTVTIADKPWMVSQEYVENKIRSFFKE
jgi:hypothetical protein